MPDVAARSKSKKFSLSKISIQAFIAKAQEHGGQANLEQSSLARPVLRAVFNDTESAENFYLDINNLKNFRQSLRVLPLYRLKENRPPELN